MYNFTKNSILSRITIALICFEMEAENTRFIFKNSIYFPDCVFAFFHTHYLLLLYTCAHTHTHAHTLTHTHTDKHSHTHSLVKERRDKKLIIKPLDGPPSYLTGESSDDDVTHTDTSSLRSFIQISCWCCCCWWCCCWCW